MKKILLVMSVLVLFSGCGERPVLMKYSIYPKDTTFYDSCGVKDVSHSLAKTATTTYLSSSNNLVTKKINLPYELEQIVYFGFDFSIDAINTTENISEYENFNIEIRVHYKISGVWYNIENSSSLYFTELVGVIRHFR